MRLLEVLLVSTTLLWIGISVPPASAGSQPGMGIVNYDYNAQIAAANRALSLAETSLSQALARSQALISQANRTADLAKKLGYLQQAADLLSTTVQLKQRIGGLRATLNQLGIERQVYENQLAAAQAAALAAEQQRQAAQAAAEAAAALQSQPTEVPEATSIAGLADTSAQNRYGEANLPKEATVYVFQKLLESTAWTSATDIIAALTKETAISDAARLNVLTSALNDPAMIATFASDPMNQSTFKGDLAVTTFKAIVVDAEALTLDRLGYHDSALLLRTAGAPLVDVAYDAATGNVPGLIIDNVQIYSQNLYKFVDLSVQLAQDEVNHRSYDDDLRKIDEINVSLMNSLYTGVATGPAFDTVTQGKPLTDEQKQIFIKILSENAKNTEDITFAASYLKTLQDVGKNLFGTLVLKSIDMIDNYTPPPVFSGIENANSTPAF